MSVETFTPDNLIASGYPIETQEETFLAGEVVERGHVLGRVTASGKIRVSKTANADGSEVPVEVAVVDIDASAGDVVGPAYKSGGFRTSELKLGTGHTAASIRAAFDGSAIILK